MAAWTTSSDHALASFLTRIQGPTLNKMTALKGLAGWKAARYVLRHPINGPRNLLALKGMRSMITPRRAAWTAAMATTAVVLPLAVRAMRNSEEL